MSAAIPLIPLYIFKACKGITFITFFNLFSFFCFYFYFYLTGKDQVRSYMVLDTRSQYFSMCTFFLFAWSRNKLTLTDSYCQIQNYAAINASGNSMTFKNYHLSGCDIMLSGKSLLMLEGNLLHLSLVLSWRWRQQILLKWCHISIRLYHVTSWKTVIVTVPTVGSSQSSTEIEWHKFFATFVCN